MHRVLDILIQRNTPMAVRVSRLPTIAMLVLLPLANAATASEAPALERWRSYTGVSWEMADHAALPTTK